MDKQNDLEELKQHISENLETFFISLEKFVSKNWLWCFTRIFYKKLDEYKKLYQGENYSDFFNFFKNAVKFLETITDSENDIQSLIETLNKIIESKWLWLGASPNDNQKLRPYLKSMLHVREAEVREISRMEYIINVTDRAGWVEFGAQEEIKFFLIDLKDIILGSPFHSTRIDSLRLRFEESPNINVKDRISCQGWLIKELWGFTLVGIKNLVLFDDGQELSGSQREKIVRFEDNVVVKKEESKKSDEFPKNFRLTVKAFSDDSTYDRSALVWLNMTKINAIKCIHKNYTLENTIEINPKLLNFEGVNTLSAHVTTYKNYSKKSWIQVTMSFDLWSDTKTIPLISKTNCTREETPTVSFQFSKDFKVKILSTTYIEKG